MFHVTTLPRQPCSACDKSSSDAAQRPPLADAAIGGPFTLIDKNGKTVRWSDFDGRYRIVYFGYTFCPDACPTDMNVIGQALQKLEKSHPALTPRVVPCSSPSIRTVTRPRSWASSPPPSRRASSA
jgi:cytochrome oxidase Cu insertion factor (SCO1/SenC/PrrC family)